MTRRNALEVLQFLQLILIMRIVVIMFNSKPAALLSFRAVRLVTKDFLRLSVT